jgi:hypothetical protein
MTSGKSWLVLGLVLAVPPSVGCQKSSVPAQAQAEHPAEVENIDGTELRRVTLTEHAMQRLDVKTAQVTEEKGPRKDQPQRAIPYSSLLYDPRGQTWVYTSPKARTFVRQKIEVDYIQGDRAYLREGPALGTQIASVGVAELYGTEFKVGH